MLSVDEVCELLATLYVRAKDEPFLFEWVNRNDLGLVSAYLVHTKACYPSDKVLDFIGDTYIDLVVRFDLLNQFADREFTIADILEWIGARGGIPTL